MKQFTTRSPCLTLTHSRWRGDFSSRALAQSWAVAVTAASSATTANSIMRFMGFLFGFGFRFGMGNGILFGAQSSARSNQKHVERGKRSILLFVALGKTV